MPLKLNSGKSRQGTLKSNELWVHSIKVGFIKVETLLPQLGSALLNFSSQRSETFRNSFYDPGYPRNDSSTLSGLQAWTPLNPKLMPLFDTFSVYSGEERPEVLPLFVVLFGENLPGANVEQTVHLPRHWSVEPPGDGTHT